jgi:4'-phosphopantetheinyl transferase EntD
MSVFYCQFVSGKVTVIFEIMPLFYQQVIDENTKLGIWRIEEPEDFFLQKVPLKKDVSHPYKRLQHLAGRYLLPTLFSDFPLSEIEIADTKKPFLPNEKFHFSISHCGNFAAAIVSTTKRVGIDVELVTPRLETISSKFLNEKEKSTLDDWSYLPHVHLQLVALMWSAKEAVFKWYGNGKVDFKQHMRLDGSISILARDAATLPFVFEKEKPIHLTVHGKLFRPLMMVWVAD